MFEIMTWNGRFLIKLTAKDGKHIETVSLPNFCTLEDAKKIADIVVSAYKERKGK